MQPYQKQSFKVAGNSFHYFKADTLTGKYYHTLVSGIPLMIGITCMPGEQVVVIFVA